MEFIESMEFNDHFGRMLDGSFGILAIELFQVIKRINETLRKESEKRPEFLDFARKVRKSRYLLLIQTVDEPITPN